MSITVSHKMQDRNIADKFLQFPWVLQTFFKTYPQLLDLFRVSIQIKEQVFIKYKYYNLCIFIMHFSGIFIFVYIL